MMRRGLTQRDQVLRYLLYHGSITRLEAAMRLGCYELASRIGELEAEGVRIKRRRRKYRNDYGYIITHTQYSLDTTPTGYPLPVPKNVSDALVAKIQAANGTVSHGERKG